MYIFYACTQSLCQPPPSKQHFSEENLKNKITKTSQEYRQETYLALMVKGRTQMDRPFLASAAEQAKAVSSHIMTNVPGKQDRRANCALKRPSQKVEMSQEI